jgi:DNA-directed RNA polymerase specialized sigma24 family protein
MMMLVERLFEFGHVQAGRWRSSRTADYAEVIILHHLDGRSFPEVARLMSRSLDSVKKLWMRALARMRDLLEDSL